MITREENDRMTRIGPGTPGGEMLRRYWWPIAFGDLLKGPHPKKVRLLGEDFVIFRDGQGRLGMLEPHCAHRRVHLQHGRVEKDGLRCCFHGWLWDAEGKCLEQPCEDPVRNSKDKVRMRSYPIQEAAGLVFAYIGPLPAPLLPRYDMLVHDEGIRYLWGFTDHCNWLQSTEQITQGERPRENGVYGEVDDAWWGIASVDQDRAAIEGQGPITHRSLERLAPSDKGVTMYRALLRQAIRDVAEGKDPLNVVRDAKKNHLVQFGTRQHDVVPPLQFAVAAA